MNHGKMEQAARLNFLVIGSIFSIGNETHICLGCNLRHYFEQDQSEQSPEIKIINIGMKLQYKGNGLIGPNHGYVLNIIHATVCYYTLVPNFKFGWLKSYQMLLYKYLYNMRVVYNRLNGHTPLTTCYSDEIPHIALCTVLESKGSKVLSLYLIISLTSICH